MEAHQHPPRRSGGAPAATSGRKGHRTERIEGSYRPITVHQLTLVWWLHAAGHLSRRQLRVYFALHEMAERRRYATKGRQPLYTLDEVLHLVGGRSGGADSRARSEIAGDLRRLTKLGLASMTDHTVGFARSADQIAVEDLTGFWEMLRQIPNVRRTVPVPRRMVRAIAAGFSRATTALIFAILIRGLFWDKASGLYRTDGRYKLSWVAEVFSVSRRQLTEARARLIRLGWIEPLEVDQWQMNRWGMHDVIVPTWKDPTRGVGGSAESASPPADFYTESASPDLTDSLPLPGNQNTRNPAPMRAGPSGVSQSSTLGSRKERPARRGRNGAPPNIRDITDADFASTARMLELHSQAVKLGISSPSEAGRLEFLAFAERARARGKKPGALLFALLRDKRSAFITLSDEDEAARRLREYFNGPTRTTTGGVQDRPIPAPFTSEDRFVAACLRVAQKRRIKDPYIVARQAEPLTRDAWDARYFAFTQKQHDRWHTEAGE